MHFRNLSFILFAYLLTIFLFSCNNSSESKLAYTDKETVKELISKKESEISWTKELEPERLVKRNTTEDKINSSSMNFSPNIAKILKNYNKPVYPELIDFGKLDVSILSYNDMERIESFCSAISRDIYSGVDTYFDGTYKFNFVFFRNDLISNWKKEFNVEFPLSEEKARENREKKQKNDQIYAKIKSIEDLQKKAEEESKKLDKTSEEENVFDDFDDKTTKKEEKEPEKLENIDDLKKEIVEIEEINIFNKWRFGEPFISNEITEIPVRFYCNDGTVDITLYLNHKKQNTIYQISIDKWGKV